MGCHKQINLYDFLVENKGLETTKFDIRAHQNLTYGISYIRTYIVVQERNNLQFHITSGMPFEIPSNASAIVISDLLLLYKYKTF